MHTDLKIQALIEKMGLDGYALWNLCLEMVGKEGHKGKLMVSTRWQDGLLKVTGWSDKKRFNEILETMGELGLICSKSLKYGNLYIPKFMKRVDDYTARKLRGEFVDSSEKVPLDKIKKESIDQIRERYASSKGFSLTDFSREDYARTAKAIKNLLLKAKGDEELVINSFYWASKQGWIDWTMETINRKWPDYMRDQGALPQELRKFAKV
jgi:hypothetical protein